MLADSNLPLIVYYLSFTPCIVIEYPNRLFVIGFI